MGLIVDTGYSDKTGQGWSVDIEDTQAAPGVTAPDVVSTRIDTGKSSDAILDVRSKKSAEVDLVLETETQHERILEIADGPSRRYRLDITKQGEATPRFRGFCLPSAISTSLNEQRTHVVTVRAKDQATGLGDPWLDNGSPYTGYQDASTIVADILATLGHGLPIKVVMNWRPDTMSQSDHPLGLQVPSDAFYREDDAGVEQPQSRGDVLADIVGRFNAILRQSRQSWQIIQPGAFRSGSSVTVWEYDSSGTYQQQTTRPATVDITTNRYRLGSDDVDAVEKEREALVTYEHGAPNELEFNGSFEDGISTNWTWTGASGEYDTGNLNYDGSVSADIEGEKVDDPLLQKATATDYTGADLGAASPSEPFEVVLRYVARATVPSSVSSYGVFWALKLAGNDGNSYWWDGSGWTQSGSPIKNAAASSYPPITSSQYDTSRHDISAPPEPGDLELRLYEPVATPKGSYDIFVTWDAIEYNRESDVASITTDQQVETGYEDGGTYQTTHRIGDGPWKGSQGTLRDNTGTDTYGWGVSGVGDYPLGRLHSRQTAKLLGAAQQRIDLRIDRGQVPTELATVAVEIGGTRYWPVRTKLDGPDGGMEVTLVRLLDVGLSSWTHNVVPGDASGGGSTAGVGGGGGSLTWDTLPNKPQTLLARGGSSDGISETVAPAKRDIASALAHSPGLPDGVQTSIRSANNATEEALATEKAIRDAINSGNKLSALSDVSSAAQSDGNVLASGGGKYREETISSLFDGHVTPIAASDIKDVSADSDPDAHHPEYTDSDAIAAVETTNITGLTVDGDITSTGGTTLWDQSAGHIPDSAIQTSPGGTPLSGGDSITIDSNDNIDFDGLGNFTTDQLSEGASNEYFTNARAIKALQAHDGTNIEADTLDGVDGSNYAQTNLADEEFEGSITSNKGGNNTRWTSGQALGTFAMEWQTLDSNGSQATRLAIKGGTDFPDIQLLNGTSGSESVKAVFQGAGNQTGLAGVTSPSYALDVGGTVNATDFRYTSDERLKTNLTQISDPLRRIGELTGYTFEWDEDAEIDGHAAGHSAQEVEDVLPEVVDDTQEYKSLKGNLTALHTEAIKALVKEVRELREVVYE